MLAHVVGYIVGASGWGGCVRAHMRQYPQGRDAAKCYASASSCRADNRDLGRADATAARPPLDFGKVLRSGTALTLQNGTARSAAPNHDSSGPLIAGAVLGPTPRQQRVKLFHGPTVDEFGKNIGQVSLRVEAIQFCCLNQGGETGPIKCPLIVARKEAILFPMEIFP